MSSDKRVEQEEEDHDTRLWDTGVVDGMGQMKGNKTDGQHLGEPHNEENNL